jgi:hypothetical protein
MISVENANYKRLVMTIRFYREQSLIAIRKHQLQTLSNGNSAYRRTNADCH